jgi:hypothetical protein
VYCSKTSASKTFGRLVYLVLQSSPQLTTHRGRPKRHGHLKRCFAGSAYVQAGDQPAEIWTLYYPGRVGCDSFGSKKAEPRAYSENNASLARWATTHRRPPQNEQRPRATFYTVTCKSVVMPQRGRTYARGICLQTLLHL